MPASSPRPPRTPRQPRSPRKVDKTELVIITGLSGSGKGTVLKALEDLGYYSVDNLPIDLIPKFAELTKNAATIRRAALVVDIREGTALEKFPALFKRIRRLVPTKLIFLDADDATLLRRFSETRRPHPLGTGQSVAASVRRERERLKTIRALAEPIINTSKFNVHELRETIHSTFGGQRPGPSGILVHVTSFGYRHGVPADSDLVFDVRCLPNPHYDPLLRPMSGLDQPVIEFLQSDANAQNMLRDIGQFLDEWLPCYIRDNRSYLTVAIGCTGGRHRSVYFVEALAQRFHLQLPVLIRHRELISV